jgi:hypothetical protein
MGSYLLKKIEIRDKGVWKSIVVGRLQVGFFFPHSLSLSLVGDCHYRIGVVTGVECLAQIWIMTINIQLCEFLLWVKVSRYEVK